MGFKNFLSFINERNNSQELGTKIDFDWSDDEISPKPWIVIDYNNVMMSITESNGCDMALLEEYLSNLFRALANCMARICVVKDGHFHSEERAVIKLNRMHRTIEDEMKPENVILDSKVAQFIAYTIFERIFNEIFGTNVCNDIKNVNNETMYIYHTADGEADSAVRIFARSRLEENDTVYIMSKDASLILGLNPAKQIFLIDVDSLLVKGKEKRQILKGKVYLLRTVLKRLGECATFPPNVVNTTIITEEMLLYIAALTDIETSYLRRKEYESPIPLLYYICNFLEPEEKKNKFNLLYTAVAIVRAWKSSPVPGDFDSFIQTVYEHAFKASQAKSQRTAKSQPLYGLHSSPLYRPDRVYVLGISSFLWKSVKQDPVENGRGKRGDFSYNTTDDGLKYSEINDVRDGCPRGFANEKVREAVCCEVKKCGGFVDARMCL